MVGESTPVVPANRLLEVAGVLSDGAGRLYEQLRHVPPAERQALLDAVLGQVGDIVQAWSELVSAVVLVEATAPPERRDEPTPAATTRPERLAGPEFERDSGVPPVEPPAEAPRRPRLTAYRQPPAPPEARGGRAAASSPEPLPTPSASAAGAGGGILTRDELTGVLNRQAGWAAMDREVERSRVEGVRFVLGYLNVNGLGRVNDSDGPRAGDELLRKVAAALRATLRSYDIILRLGGDDFLYALPGADLATAEQRLLEFNVILGNEAPGASVSVGFAELHEGESFDELVVRADDALVQARRQRGLPRLR